MVTKFAIEISYKRAIILALILHMVLLSALFVRLPVPENRQAISQNVKIIKAVAVSETQINQALAKRRALEQQRLAQARARQLAQEKAAREKALALKREQQRQAQLKAQRLAKAKALAAKRKAAAQKAQALKAQRQKQAHAKKQALEKAQQAKLAAQKAHALQAKKMAAEERELMQQLQNKALTSENAQLEKAAQAQQQREIDQYKAKIIQAISQHWLEPDVNKNVSATLLIRLGPGGVVLSVQVLKSSGQTVLDRSAETAVYKASPLPIPENPQLFAQFRVLNLTVRPERQG